MYVETVVTDILQKLFDIQVLTEERLFERITFLGYWLKVLSCTLISIAIPIGLYILFRNYASAGGLSIESGCHGPESGFGMLSGILLCLQLRFSSTISNS